MIVDGLRAEIKQIDEQYRKERRRERAIGFIQGIVSMVFFTMLAMILKGQ
jgi:hypothetical protein